MEEGTRINSILTEQDNINEMKFSNLQDLLVSNQTYSLLFYSFFHSFGYNGHHLISINALRVYMDEQLNSPTEEVKAPFKVRELKKNAGTSVASVQALRYYLVGRKDFFNFIQKTGSGKGKVKFSLKRFTVPKFIMRYAYEKMEEVDPYPRDPREWQRLIRYRRSRHPTKYFINEVSIFHFLEQYIEFGNIEYEVLDSQIFEPIRKKINNHDYIKQTIELGMKFVDYCVAYIPFRKLKIVNPFQLIFEVSDEKIINDLVTNHGLDLTNEIEEINRKIAEHVNKSREEIKAMAERNEGPFFSPDIGSFF